MEFTARQIADFLNGQIEGNPEVKVNRLSKIEEGEPGSLSFLSNPKYTQYIYTTNASIVIVNQDFIPEQNIAATLVRVNNAYTAFAHLLEIYNKYLHTKTGISSLAFVSPKASIGKNVYIGEFCYIGEDARIEDDVKIYPQTFVGDNVLIGQESLIYAGVKIYAGNSIGKRCTLHSGVVIGSDGFGFAPQEDNHYKKVAQIGNVVIEDDVEIGANTTIDRATLGSTFIRKGAKLDNLIQIAHNVDIGENTVIVAQTGISGSTKIGKNCMIAGQVGIIGHLNIADNVKIGAQSGISQNLKDGITVLGSPAFEISKYRKAYVYFRNLASLSAKIDALEKKLKEYESKH